MKYFDFVIRFIVVTVYKNFVCRMPCLPISPSMSDLAATATLPLCIREKDIEYQVCIVQRNAVQSL